MGKELKATDQPLVSRGIDDSTWNALKTSLYPGAADDSVLMVVDYCKARGLDPLMKPVHIVPMSIKQGDKYAMRDVVMPGIGCYRIQASRSGDLAGTSSPLFGEIITEKLGTVNMTYPEWCEITVTKLIGDRLVDFTAREYFTENYATKGREETPNAMWQKRPRGQLAKCAEAQALRKGWPEIGQQATFEEMAGKTERDITPKPKQSLISEAAEVEDLTWFDEIIEGISNAVDPNMVNDLYASGVEVCKQKGNAEANDHIKQACIDKIGRLEAQ